MKRNCLPEAYCDFIFAIIVEELGLIGGIVVMMLYLFLLYRAGVVARRSPDVFSAILVIGVTLIMVLQAFVHIAVCAGLIPLTGQPLPLISNGGTSIMVNSVYLGIIIAITRTMYNNDGTIKETKSEYAPAALLTVDVPVPDDEELMQA